MEIAFTTQKEVMLAIRQRLITRVSGFLTTDNCYLDDEAMPAHQPQWTLGCSIVMESGEFQPNSGGSACNVVERNLLVVTPMIRFGDGDPETLTGELAESDTPITELKHRVLSALMVDNVDGSRKRWEPVDQNGHHLLVDSLTPTSSRGPRRAEQWPLLAVSLVFHCAWRWRL